MHVSQASSFASNRNSLGLPSAGMVGSRNTQSQVQQPTLPDDKPRISQGTQQEELKNLLPGGLLLASAPRDLPPRTVNSQEPKSDGQARIRGISDQICSSKCTGLAVPTPTQGQSLSAGNCCKLNPPPSDPNFSYQVKVTGCPVGNSEEQRDGLPRPHHSQSSRHTNRPSC